MIPRIAISNFREIEPAQCVIHEGVSIGIDTPDDSILLKSGSCAIGLSWNGSGIVFNDWKNQDTMTL